MNDEEEGVTRREHPPISKRDVKNEIEKKKKWKMENMLEVASLTTSVLFILHPHSFYHYKKKWTHRLNMIICPDEICYLVMAGYLILIYA